MQENNSRALQLVRAIGQKLREHKADIIILALLFIIGFCGAYMGGYRDLHQEVPRGDKFWMAASLIGRKFERDLTACIIPAFLGVRFIQYCAKKKEEDFLITFLIYYVILNIANWSRDFLPNIYQRAIRFKDIDLAAFSVCILFFVICAARKFRRHMGEKRRGEGHEKKDEGEKGVLFALQLLFSIALCIAIAAGFMALMAVTLEPDPFFCMSVEQIFLHAMPILIVFILTLPVVRHEKSVAWLIIAYVLAAFIVSRMIKDFYPIPGSQGHYNGYMMSLFWTWDALRGKFLIVLAIAMAAIYRMRGYNRTAVLAGVLAAALIMYLSSYDWILTAMNMNHNRTVEQILRDRVLKLYLVKSQFYVGWVPVIVPYLLNLLTRCREKMRQPPETEK